MYRLPSQAMYHRSSMSHSLL